MPNTLTLSSDQQALLLIDDHGLTRFALSKENGILIGLLAEQLAVEYAATDSAAVWQQADTTELHWTCTFNARRNQLVLIGLPNADDSSAARSVGQDDVHGSKGLLLPAATIIPFDLNQQAVILRITKGVMQWHTLKR